MKVLAALLLALVLAVPAAAVAPTPALPLLLYGDESVAAADGARGQLFNPATVGLRYPSEFLFSWTRGDPKQETNHLLYAYRGFGFAATRVKDLMQGYGFSLAGGNSEALRFGFTQTWLSSGLSHEVKGDQRIGLLSRPAPWLSLGGTLDHLFQPDFQGNRLNRDYTLGLGLRPLAWSRAHAAGRGTRFTVTGDLVIPEDGEWGQARVRIGGEIEPFAGILLRGSFEDHGGVHVGIGVAAPRIGFHNQVVSREDEPRSQSYNVTIHDGEDLSVLPTPRSRRVAALRLGGELGDEGLAGLSLFGPVSTTPVAPVHRALERTLDDPLTSGLLLELRGVSNMAQLEELRPRIERLRSAGKPVVAYLEEGATRGDLYLASACDRIVTTPEAGFAALGLRAERRYYRSLLANWGVRIDRSSVGKYKSAFRNFSVDSTPPADRESIERALDQQQALFVAAVASGRHMERERLLTLLDGRDWPAHEVQRAGLVDSIGYREDALQTLGRLCGLGDAPRVVGAGRPRAATRTWNLPQPIAVVYASGGIDVGRSGNDLLMGPTMGAETMTRQIEAAFRQPGVKAVVLRVESPGGSVVASNLIDHALVRMKRETRKPLIVSMGSVAASGGYYISAHADHIVADRFTRTGSIGVVFYKPSIEGWDRKHGVREDDFERGRYMGAWSLHRSWDAALQASADSAIGDVYGRFLDKVAAGRGLSRAETERVAQGRVWLGEDARARRLVDEIGGLEQAVRVARARAGVPEGEVIRLAEFRRPRPALLERLASSAVNAAWQQVVALPDLDQPLLWADDAIDP
ncbi:MAG TPA: signal peptide peptidase SppA [Candidatus Eisenbacteria bacterium]